MNKLIKLLLIGGLALLLIGGATTFGLYLTTGIHSIDLNMPGFVKEFRSLTINRNGISFSPPIHEGDSSEINETYTSITGVDIDCTNCSISIKETKENKVTLKGNKRSSSTASYELKNDVLVITITNPDKNLNTTSDQITIYVPENTVLVDSKINTNMGNLKIDDIDFVNLNLQLDMGNVEIKDCDIDQADIVLHLGDLNFDGNLKNKVTIANNLGNITMDIDEELRNVTYDCSLALGDFMLNHKKEDSIFKKESSSEKLNLNIDASLGNIKLSFDD